MGAKPRAVNNPVEKEPTPTIPCWLCGRPIAVRMTQSGRPFLVCMDCGLQMFIRSSAGEDRLNARLSQPATDPVAKGGGPS
jgi:hypothetical protein